MITFGTSRTLRRSAAVAASVTMLTGAAFAVADPARASTVTLTVVGTSDVSDSNLIQYLTPKFQADNPGITLKYVSLGTSAAIAYAEAGTADALIVHAASLENQFVNQGYSAESYGRAVFWGDYVLAGASSDPAGVVKNGHDHDIVSAFEDIAKQGAAGRANFISRSAAPGTTVQEHAIWAQTSGVTLCTVSAANGGGMSPSTTPGDCPTTISYPSWYHSGDRKQAANVTYTNACNINGNGPTSNCYALTDRGTYQYLNSMNQVPNLKIVTRNNDTKARGGIPALVNSFHAYAVNAAKFPNATIHTAQAKDFLNWLTSPTGQKAVGDYLANDPNGRPFIPDAQPALTVTPLVSKVASSHPITFRGSLKNVVPGARPIAGQTFQITSALLSQPTAPLTPLASVTTDADGNFSYSYVPTQNRRYSISVPALTQIENAALTPAFGDLLAPVSANLGAVHVLGTLASIKLYSRKKGVLHAEGVLRPPARSTQAYIKVYTRKVGSRGGFTYRAVIRLKAGAGTFSADLKLGSGKIQFVLGYYDSSNFDVTASKVFNATVI